LVTRQRIGTFGPPGSGGCGGPAPTGNLNWGPDFGESAGNDDTTWRLGVNLDIATLALEHTKTVGVMHTMPALALTSIVAQPRLIGGEVLVAPFDQGDISGSLTLDRSGTGNHLTSAFPEQVVFGPQLYSGGYTIFGTNPNPKFEKTSPIGLPASTLTAMGWVKVFGVAQDTGAVSTKLVFGDTSPNGSWAVGIRYDSASGSLRATFEIVNGSGTLIRLTGTTALPVSAVWYHVAGTYDGTSLRVYLNGVLDGTLSSAGLALATSGVTLYAGFDQGSASFPTSIDEARVYNRVLDVTEINLVAFQPSIGLRTDAHLTMPTLALAHTKTVGVNVDLESLAVVYNALGVGANVDLEALAVTYNALTVGVNVDLEALAIVYNALGVGVNVDLESLALEHTKTIGATVTMPALALEHTKTARVHLSGSVLGAPFWQSEGHFGTTAAGPTNITCDIPPGTQVGDLLLAYIAASNTTTTPIITTPSGWTDIRSDTLDIAGGAVVNIVVKSMSRIADGTEGATKTFTVSGATNITSEIHRLNGVHQTTPIDAHAGATLIATAIDPDPSAPAVTTVADNCMVFAYLAHYHATVNQTHTSPASHVERTDFESDNATTGTVLGSTSATRVFATAGSQAAVEFNCTETVATDAVMQRIAIAPGSLVVAA